MKCKDVQGVLEAFLDGELAPARRAEVEDHLAACDPCAEELAELATVGRLVRESIDLRVAEAVETGAFDGLWGRIAKEIAPVPEPSTFWERLFGGLWERQRAFLVPAVAAAAVLAIMVGLVATRTGERDNGSGPEGETIAATAPVEELPPYAAPSIAPPESAVAATGGAPGGNAAPGRRGREEAVAQTQAIIVAYEVDAGIVVIDSETDDPDQPVVVWHFMPEDEKDGGGPM